MTTRYIGYGYGRATRAERRHINRRDRTIARYWHHKLTGEPCDGRSFCTCYPRHDAPRWVDTGHLKCPCSRYGRDGDDCAWWAIAACFVYEDANGDGFTADGVEGAMSLAVNDSDGIAALVWDNWHAVPPYVRRMIGTRRDAWEEVSEQDQAQFLADKS